MSDASIASEISEAGNATTKKLPRLEVGRVIHSAWYGPCICVGTHLTPGKIPTDRYDYKIRSIFAPDSAPIIRQERAYLTPPIEPAVLDAALVALQTPAQTITDLSPKSRKDILMSGDIVRVAQLASTLAKINSEDVSLLDDSKKAQNLLAKTFAGRAIATRRSSGTSVATLDDRLKYLSRAEFVVKRVLADKVGTVTIQNFYSLEAPLPKKVEGTATPASSPVAEEKVLAALAPFRPELRAQAAAETAGTSGVPWTYPNYAHGIRGESRPPEGGKWNYPMGFRSGKTPQVAPE
ncbi:MAG TPA: hypothetical protein VFR09_07675 [Alphaproteobacteria bacterium]|nr:hypothetical protein [Alphaproteobacteria bacterium]